MALLKNLMLFFFLYFINGKLLVFNDTTITKGFQIQRSIDSTGLSYLSYLEISNCTSKNIKECKLDIIYYRNNDTSIIFSNYKSDKILNICCNDQDAKDNKCKLNSINLQKDSPYTHVEYFQSDSMKFVTVPSTSEAIWSVLITTCVSDEISFKLNGYIDYKPNYSTYIDERIKKISIFCLQSCISCFVFLLCYIIAQHKFNPQIITIQNSFHLLVFLACISDLFIFIYFNYYDKKSICLFYLLFYSALFRTTSRVLLLKITYDGLQYPNLISNFIVIPLFFIYYIYFVCELYGIHEIPSRISGDWFFGYGNSDASLIFFLINLIASIYILYSSIYKSKNITNTEKRRKFTYMITLNSIVYAILNFLLIVVRRNRSLDFARNLELITFCIEPFNFYILAIINSWYLFIFNAQGWEQIDNNQDNENIDVGVDSLNKNNENRTSLVGSGYGLPSYMLNQKPEFIIDGLDDEDAPNDNNNNNT